MTDQPAAPEVVLDHWHHRIFGDRWTLTHAGRAILTFGSETEARQAARRHGWRVAEMEGGQ